MATAVAVSVAWRVTTLGSAAAGPVPRREQVIDLSAFQIIDRESGPLNYYKLFREPTPLIRAEYPVGADTAVLGYRIPDARRRSVATLRWKWRARVLPRGGNECAESRGDSAAAVYVTWKRALRWYTVKYVWSTAAPKGSTCRRKRNPFVAQDTVIAESGPPLDEWRVVDIAPDSVFRNHFERGDPQARVPDLVGIGIMSDGDQTRSPSSADYADFALTWKN